MRLETFAFNSKTGWSVRRFPPLDSDKTLVVVFGSTEFMDDQRRIAELFGAYPKSHFIGCSTSGEIHQSKIYDSSLSVAVAKFDGGRLATATAAVEQSSQSSFAGETLARRLHRPDLRAVLVLSPCVRVVAASRAAGPRRCEASTGGSPRDCA